VLVVAQQATRQLIVASILAQTAHCCQHDMMQCVPKQHISQCKFVTLQLPKPVAAKPVGLMGGGRMGGMGGGYGRGGGGGGGYENGMGEMGAMGGMGGMSQMGMGQMGGMGGYGMGEPSCACLTVFHPAKEPQILQMKTSAFVLCCVTHTYMGKL